MKKQDVTMELNGLSESAEKQFNFQHLEKQSLEKPVLVLFTGKWLGSSQIMKFITDSMSKKYQNKLHIAKFEFSSLEQTDNSFYTDKLPLIIVLDQGRVVVQQTGIIPKNKLDAMLKEYVN